MPKLKESNTEKINKRITGVLLKYMAVNGVRNKDALAEVIQISRNAIFHRFRNPGLFRLEELRMLYDYLHVPPDERYGLMNIND